MAKTKVGSPNNLHILEQIEATKDAEFLAGEKSNHLNELSCEKLNIDTETPRCNRARLDTGPLCNYHCEFCYFIDILHVKTDWDLVKKRIDYMYDYGITEIDMSGGESSISPDWFKILDYCNERFESISCLTHGGKFSDYEFLKKSKEHGLKEILFSLHGPTKEIHESITGRKQSFDKILQGIRNAKELGLIVRLNCTVYYKNVDFLEEYYADLVNEINPAQCNFITLNYWGEYINIEFENESYTAMTDAIKRTIDKINDGIHINVRYVPYCYMKGYEKYVLDNHQHIYDTSDWNKEMYNYSVDVTKKYTDYEKLEFAYAEASRQRNRFYSKSFDCLKCKNYYICDGIEKEIADKTAVHPELGEKIKEVNFYRKDTDRRS